MLRIPSVIGLFLTGLFFVSNRAAAEDWPGWRGPRGDGTALDENIPLRWNGESGENIHWKVAVPGEGMGSPIVRGDRVFLVSCLTETEERILVCLDRRTGKILWQQAVVKSPLEIKHRLNSFASSTPAADDDTVYVAFLEIDGSEAPAPNVGTPRPLNPGQIVVAAYDFAGKQKWLVRPGGFASVHGFCSNPVLYRDLVIVNGDHDGDSYIAAMNRNTGETVWKQPRPHKTRSYATPLIRDIDGEPQMAFAGSMHIASYDPRDGSTRWRVEGPAEQFVASMVYDGRQFYMAAGFPTYHVMAIRPDGSGDVTSTHVAWHVKNVSCYVPSPVLVGPYLFVADDRGTANCFDTATGKRLWQTRLGTHYSASLVTAAGRVYFTADDGITKIVQPAEELNVIAENTLGESCFASPALANGQIFLRGEKHVFCIGTPDRAGSE
jgi:outer membrane protein assembly factor BamB